MVRKTNPAATMLMRPANAWAMKPTPPKLKLLVLVITQALALQMTQAATILVTSNLDDGTDCTLREAIATVNAGADLSNGCVIDASTDALGTNDTITFGSTVTGSTITTNGQLVMSKSVSINPGGDQTTIDANGTNRVMSIMYVSGVGPTVSMDQLTITGGNNNLPIGVSNNPNGINGSGIVVQNANLNLNNSTVSGNIAAGTGGGILVSSSTVSISNSTISGNSANFGGGIYANTSSSLTLNNSTVSGNSAGNVGGGISAYRSTVALSNSTISGNTAVSSGGGVNVRTDSGILVNRSTLSVSNSTVSGNRAIFGGGIYAFSSTLSLSNSTVSSNIASNGGGIYVYLSSMVSLNNSTVSGNSAYDDGSGIFANSSVVSVSNSLFANESGDGFGDDCQQFNSATIAGPDSIMTFQGNCGSGTAIDSNLDTTLGPLTDNGGPTLTHALLIDSPAIDNGTGVGATAGDQRGFAAVGVRDSGAFEFGSVEPNAFDPVTLVNNRWAMVGLSQVLPSMTVQAVFAITTPTGLLPSDYNRLWVVYRRDESTDSYVQLALGDTLEQGRGYWVLQITGSELEFAPSGGATALDDTNPNCLSTDGCFEIDLEEGDGRYNLISHPFTTDVNWNDIRIEVNGVQVCNPAQAASNGLVDDLFSNYNGNSYDMFSSTIPMPAGGVFEAFRGYWVQTLSGSVGVDVKLLVPKGPVSDSPSCALPAPVASMDARAASGDSQVVVASEDDNSIPWWLSWMSVAQAAEDTTLKGGEWWVRLQAQSSENGGMLDQYNYLGWYRDSEDGKDRRDLKELPPFGSPYLTIVFRHDDWVEDAGDYATDLRARKPWREGEHWDFIVKSDKVGREVTLSWEGYSKARRFYRMRLVDMESGKTVRTVRRGKLLTYRFTTQSTEHRFKWVSLARPK